MADEKLILDISIPTEEPRKNVTDLTSAIVTLTAENKQLKKAIKDGTGDTVKNSQQLAENKVKLSELNKERKNNIKTIRTSEKAEKDINEILNRETKSLNDLKAQNSELIQIRNNLDKTTVEGAKQFDTLNEKILENTQTLKKGEQAGGSFRRSVGDYKGELRNASPALGNVIKGTKNLSKQFLKLLANPIVALISAIVAGLTALFKAFKKTQEGQDTFNKLFVQAGAAIDAVLGRLGRLAKAAVAFIKGDVKGAAELATGAFKGLREEIEETVKEAGNIEDARIELRRLTAELTTAIAEVQKVAELQGAIADDATKSFQERQAAASKAFDAELKARNLEITLAQKNLEIIQSENALKKQQGFLTDKLRQAEAVAKVAVIEAEKAKELAVLNNTKRINELRQDDFEQQLDFLFDVSDAQKTVNERRLTDERLNLEERKKILKETETLLNDSFDQQLALFERENEINLSRTKLLELNNNEIFEYARGLGLSEIETNRLLEAIKERRFALQDLADAQKDLSDEEIQRKEAANERLRELQADETLSLLEGLEERREELLKLEEEDFERKLENDTLLAEEREVIEEEHKLRLIEIDNEYRDAVIENQDIIVDSTLKAFDSILDAAGEFNTESINAASTAAGQLLQISNDVKAGRITDEEATAAAVSSITTGLANTITAIGQEQLNNFKANKDEEVQKLINSGLTKEQAEKEFANQVAEKELKQFNLEKAAALLQVGIQTAIAVAKSIAASPLTGGLPFSAIVAGLGIAQAAIIASKKPPPKPSFAEGGKAAVIGGNFHSQGGTPIFAGRDYVGEAEKNEGIFIMKRSATAELLSQVNQQHGGRSWFGGRTRFAQEGGELGTGQNQQFDFDAITTAIRQGVQDITVVTSVEDINLGQQRRQRVLNNKVV